MMANDSFVNYQHSTLRFKNIYGGNYTADMDHINNTFKQCHVAHSNPICVKHFVGIISTQALIFFVGVILNLIVISAYYHKRSLQKKNKNMLLLNQAFADMVNMICYLLPKLLYMIYQVITHKKMMTYAKITFSMLHLTASSSIGLFTVISVEMFLSLYMPFWHRSNVLTRHLWRAVVFVWSLALLLTIVPIIILFRYDDESKGLKELANYEFYVGLSVGVFIMVVTMLFALNFIKAFKSIRSNPIRAAQDQRGQRDHIRNKKEFRVTLIFLAMFVIFLLTFLPAVYAEMTKFCPIFHSVCTQTFNCTFIVASVFNPLLVLCLKKEFRWKATSTTNTKSPRSTGSLDSKSSANSIT